MYKNLKLTKLVDFIKYCMPSRGLGNQRIDFFIIAVLKSINLPPFSNSADLFLEFKSVHFTVINRKHHTTQLL